MIRVNQIVRVVDPSEVAQARRAASQCAEALGMGEIASGHAALLATELATNLVKHGGGGSMMFGSDDTRAQTLVVVAIDKGRGIANVAAALRDGYSTSGSPGTGLGAITRSAAAVDIYTLDGKGTAIYCNLSDEPQRAYAIPGTHTYPVAGVSLPKPGETAFGDDWAAHSAGDVVSVLVADGLGHGPAAATASAAAARTFRERTAQPLELLLADIHDALRGTRGAALALARIFVAQRRVDFVGVGNIAGTIASDDGMRRTVSLPGIVGHEMRKVQTFSYPWDPSSALIMQSDGLATTWSLANYPGLLQKEAALIAAVLYRDLCRGNDDATVVVVKAS